MLLTETVEVDDVELVEVSVGWVLLELRLLANPVDVEENVDD